MKAQFISERVNFERGQDPLKAMDLGNSRLKNKFLKLFPEHLENGDSQTFKDWKKIQEIILDTTTEVSFKPGLESLSHKHNKIHITLTLPEHRMNYFFFESIQNVIDRNSPKVLYITQYDNKKMDFFYYTDES